MQRFCKIGFAAMMFFMGAALPSLAQDEDASAEAATVAKKQAKPAKKYPMVEISGKVVDAATGEALPGVKLHAYNNSNYTAMTDENGDYTISVPTFVTSLATDYEDYNATRTAINGRTSGVVIAIYSSQFKKDYDGSASASKSVSTEGFEQTTAYSADEEISNRLGADVRTISRSAIPGLGDAMFINGFNSLNSNAQPLIILDGVIFDMMYDSSILHTSYFNNLLNTISMDDIESIEVLKNGTAIYGAKAANGVIVINTKRCHSMATRIDVNIHGGVELLPNRMEMMNAGQYRGFASELLGSTPTKLTEFKFLSNDPNYPYYNMYHNNTDWEKVAYHEAFNQNYSIDIQGGDDVASYNLAVGFADAQSTLRMNDMQRFNIRFNADIWLNKWFTTKFDASYTNITRDLRDDGLTSDYATRPLAAPGFLSLAKSPFVSPYDFSNDGKVSHYFADADDYLKEVLGDKASLANPKAILENGEAKNKNHVDNSTLSISVAPTWKPTKNFSLTERFYFGMQSYDESYFTPLVGMPVYHIAEYKNEVQNSKQSIFTKHNSVFSETRADWTLPLGAHRVDIFGGFRYLNDSYTASDLRGDNTGTDKTPNLSNSLANTRMQGVDTEWSSLSYFANIDYNYKETYYLTAQLAMETSSRFGKDVESGLKMFGVNWGFFPSIQGAWVLTNEKWFRPNKGINMLKLNAGFESVGNDGIDNSASLTYMSASAMIGNGITSIGLTNIGNPKLQWETTNRFNAGIEGNFLNNRLNVKANYFYSKTNNLVTLGTLAYVAGVHDYYTNDGSLSNTGFDVAANAKIINEKNFKFELGASVGHYKNKIESLPQGQKSFTTDMYNGSILTEIGRPVGVFYGYKVVKDNLSPKGIFSSSADAQASGLYVTDKTGAKNYFGAGDVHFYDKDNNGEINADDRVVIGDPNPDIYGNINANFHFGSHWSLGATFSYSLGNDIYNFQRAILESGSQFMNQTTAVGRRWIVEGQTTDIPKAVYGDPMQNSRFSDRWIEDGSYLKLKNVTLSYKLPIRNEYIQGITLWAAGNNLVTFTKYLGADPELSCGNGVLLQGIDAGYVSAGRSFHLGVKINL